MAPRTYLCALCIDTKRNVLEKPEDIVMPLVDSGQPTLVVDLLNELRATIPPLFVNVRNSDIVIWKLRTPKPMLDFSGVRTRSQATAAPTLTHEHIQNVINAFDLNAHTVKLRPKDVLQDHFNTEVVSQDVVDIIVQVPAVVRSATGALVVSLLLA